MKILGNIIWLVFGGLHIALKYFVASIFLCITIIGIPFGMQTLKLSWLALWPFGKEVIKTERTQYGTHVLLNIVWIIFAGFWIWLAHLFYGVLLTITIIGIPFGRQHFKLAGLAFTPFGKEIKDGQ